MRKRLAQGFALLLTVLMASAASAEVGLRGWGPRVGLSSDPDQVVGGVHFDLGEFTDHVRWQPSAEIGVGDDVLSVGGNMMVAYYFPVKGKVTPYAGGQLSAFFLDRDDDKHGKRDDTDTEIGLAAVGGIETPLSGGKRFLVELQLGLGDVPDVKAMAGWTF